MIRTIAIVAFGSVLACAAQAMPLAPPLHPADGMFTLAAMGCGPGMVMVNGNCVPRGDVRQERRCLRWTGNVCAQWED